MIINKNSKNIIGKALPGDIFRVKKYPNETFMLVKFSNVEKYFVINVRTGIEAIGVERYDKVEIVKGSFVEE